MTSQSARLRKIDDHHVTICATCNLCGRINVLSWGPIKRPGEYGISHGLCRYHALESYEDGGLLTTLESLELDIRRYWIAWLAIIGIAGFLIGQILRVTM